VELLPGVLLLTALAPLAQVRLLCCFSTFFTSSVVV
jgi:hypothetical protein